MTTTQATMTKQSPGEHARASQPFDLTPYGITVTDVRRNLSPAELYIEAIREDAKCNIADSGALIAFSVEAGAILARIPPDSRTPLRGYARDIGLAFQIADDIMDVEGDEALAGKALHKDEAAGKATFVTLMGLERAREQATALVDQAIGHLASYGEEATLLRAIARYVVERDR